MATADQLERQRAAARAAANKAVADKAAADARAKAARDKAARDKAAKNKAAKDVENQTTTTTTPEVSAEEAARRAAQEIENARLQTQRVDWTEQLSLLFKNYGLESLAPLIKQYVQDGYSADTVTLKLQDAPEYQRRFAGNESRKKAGLPVLSPAEYLATESAYKQIMRTAGLPEGFYDSYDDFSGFIGVDVSPSELKSRVDAASLSLEGSDPYYKESLQNMYGLSSGDMLAYTLDPQRSLPFINKRVQSAQFGAAARRQGLNIGTSTAEQYADMGVTRQQAEQGFQAVAQIAPVGERLSQIYGREQAYGQEQAISEAFGGPMGAEAATRRKRLSEMEQATFGGKAGISRGSLSQGTQGQF
jgi:hypothetical protein